MSEQLKLTFPSLTKPENKAGLCSVCAVDPHVKPCWQLPPFCCRWNRTLQFSTLKIVYCGLKCSKWLRLLIPTAYILLRVDDISVQAMNLRKNTSMHHTSQRHALTYGDLEEEPNTNLKVWVLAQSILMAFIQQMNKWIALSLSIYI